MSVFTGSRVASQMRVCGAGRWQGASLYAAAAALVKRPSVVCVADEGGGGGGGAVLANIRRRAKVASPKLDWIRVCRVGRQPTGRPAPDRAAAHSTQLDSCAEVRPRNALQLSAPHNGRAKRTKAARLIDAARRPFVGRAPSRKPTERQACARGRKRSPTAALCQLSALRSNARAFRAKTRGNTRVSRMSRDDGQRANRKSAASQSKRRSDGGRGGRSGSMGASQGQQSIWQRAAQVCVALQLHKRPRGEAPLCQLAAAAAANLA